MVSALKGIGYFVSTISVILLGIVALEGAKEKPLLLACLIAGMAASVLGMTLRWWSHRRDREEKERLERLIRAK
jgi:hypothetical protein